ncbi:DNA mismatch repair endonuclease MutL [Methanofollis aquaemaris]|nr:DNA mismatch repair endonuclease MutL [Methanofollis aquaemaris]
MSMQDATIRVLPVGTVNQIAAGEVVERPASVVKELVENAVDAGAGLVRVEVTSDRRQVTGVRVVDDGIGMGRADAVLAFKEHATSKIREIEDLDCLHTLGFRGEALASIASVAEVTIVTKPRDRGVIAGIRVRVRGGGDPEVSEVGAPDGTSVEVKDLFFNTPARRKFLKSLHTELAHIHGVVEKTALAHPEVAFRLLHNGRERIATHAADDLRETAGALFGTDLTRALVPVGGGNRFVRVGGFVARPSHTRADQYQIFLSVNGRPVYSAGIVRAIKEGYGTLLPANRFPIAFLALTTEDGLVDANVHPTKRQVRFTHEREVYEAVTETVRTALHGEDLLAGEREAEVFTPPPAPRRPARPVAPAPTTAPRPGVGESPALYAKSDRRLRQTELPLAGAERNRLPEVTVLGQVDATYIVGSTGGRSLVLIDQHAAHERILYEQVQAKQASGPKTQELIVPVLVTFSPTEVELVREALPLLAEEGFVVEEFGPSTFAVNAIPVVLGKLEEPEVIRDLVSALVREGPSDPVGRREAITRRVACRGAIKAGDPLTTEQMQRLVEQLAHTENPYTCPHGRPTVILFSPDEMAAMFRRT